MSTSETRYYKLYSTLQYVLKFVAATCGWQLEYLLLDSIITG